MTTIHKNSIIFLFAGVFVVCTAQASFCKEIDNQDYPIKEPFMATLTSMNVSNSGYAFIQKSRSRWIRMDEDRPNYRYSYWRNKKSSALAVLVPGFNGSCRDAVTANLAKVFYLKGYSVVQVSSPMKWTFVQSVSSAPAPGYIPDNSKDLRLLISRIIQSLEEDENKKFTFKTLTGLSLGAINTLFIADHERKEPLIGFDHYYAVNPPVAIQETFTRLDNMYADSLRYLRSLGPDRWNESLSFLNLYEMFQHSSHERQINLMPQEAALAVGYSLKRGVAEFIVVSQEQLDMGVLSNQSSFFHKQNGYDEANQMTLQDYAREVVFRYYQQYAQDHSFQSKTFEDLLYETSLYAIQDTLSNSKSITLFHTQDDPMISRQSVQFLCETMTDESLFLYRYGGHLGVLLDRQFKNDFYDAIQSFNRFTIQ
ncbi:MAG: hypothetical protein JXR73_19615 [Candidatus Omnitrophica bacterium]|nr:hypothetical protein [Candidatus Omnitrophota bacterium]